jgi:hypothetical protein
MKLPKKAFIKNKKFRRFSQEHPEFFMLQIGFITLMTAIYEIGWISTQVAVELSSAVFYTAFVVYYFGIAMWFLQLFVNAVLYDEYKSPEEIVLLLFAWYQWMTPCVFLFSLAMTPGIVI